VRSIDLRYLERWAAGRRKPALRQMGVDDGVGEPAISCSVLLVIVSNSGEGLGSFPRRSNR